jgi:hypothetical protein
MSVAAGVLWGIGPALAASRPVLPNSLKGESALDRPGKQWSLRNILVVVQISLCFVLLCTTGLFLRSLDKSAEEWLPDFDRPTTSQYRGSARISRADQVVGQPLGAIAESSSAAFTLLFTSGRRKANWCSEGNLRLRHLCVLI